MKQRNFLADLTKFEANREKLQVVKLLCTRSKELSEQPNATCTYARLKVVKEFCDEYLYTPGFVKKAYEFIKNYKDTAF